MVVKVILISNFLFKKFSRDHNLIFASLSKEIGIFFVIYSWKNILNSRDYK